MRHLLRAAALVLVCVAGACSSPCDAIAERGCAAAGADSDECKQLRETATRASSEDERACEVALRLVETVDRVK
ncbi:MAG: hypothetical protein H6744_02300 [Deltaproteobacteria bacterium]|nr:hypothetical protein [Deltaproteobacteria bacterium]MCB9785502.1 hypothetical protein [Deltaproteobacteria bacterium]